MNVNRNDFLKVLQLIKPATSTKGSIEDISCFLFQKGMIYAYNDHLCIGHKSPIALDNISIPALELIKILQKISSDEITIDLQEGAILIKGGKTKAQLKLVQSRLSEMIPDVSNNEWGILPSDFMDGLFLCLFSASKDTSVPFLNSILVKNDQVISSDNFRISRYQLEASIGTTFLIPLSSVVELQAFHELSEFSINDGWVFFRNASDDGCLFCSRLISADYPNIDGFFADIPMPEFELPVTLKDGMSVCDVLSDANQIDKKIDLSFFGGEIICRGEGIKGSVEYSVQAQVPDGIEFSVNPIFLSQILDHSVSACIVDGKLIFSSGEKFMHIMALPS